MEIQGEELTPQDGADEISQMSNAAQPPVTALVAIREAAICRTVVAALEHLRFPYRLHSLDKDGELFDQPSIVHIVRQMRNNQPTRLPRPIVLLVRPSRAEESEETWEPTGTALLDLGGLTPVSMLRSLIVSTLGTNTDFVVRHLVRLKMFSRTPEALVHVFLRDPRRMTHLGDLRREMHLSRAKAQALIHFTGRFERAEHLLAALRCASWAALMQQDLTRSYVEDFLGMKDASTVRRACRRAGVPAPHRGLSLSAFPD